jgi:thymidylate kinase
MISISPRDTKRIILVIEGADASGKTTLANHFREKYGARYIHGTVREDAWKWHLGVIHRAVKLSKDNMVIIDRSWISHLIYESIFNTQKFDVAGRAFDRILRRYGALTIMCVPRDQERQIERWKKGRENGKHEHYKEIRNVISAYSDLYLGNIAHPGEGYIDQLTRFGDFMFRDDVRLYDIDIDGQRIQSSASLALRHAMNLRDKVIPYGKNNLVGRVSQNVPGTLFVFSIPEDQICYWPLVAREGLNPDTFFNAALHSLKIREDRISMYNCINDQGEINNIITNGLYRRIVSVGPVAHSYLKGLGISSSLIPYPEWYIETFIKNKKLLEPWIYAERYILDAIR